MNQLELKCCISLLVVLLPSLYTFLKKTFPEEITIFPKEAFTFFINLIRNIMKQRENGGGKVCVYIETTMIKISFS